MNKGKVDKQKTQVKLVFGGVQEPAFDLSRVMEELGLEFHAFASSAGVLVMKSLMEAEEISLAGEKGSHGTEINRYGRNPGSVGVGGQKVSVERRRLRTRDGREVRLTSYDAFHRTSDRSLAVYERLIGGISCRDYAQTVEAVADGYGVSKSVVNRDMLQATSKDLAALCEKDLGDVDILVLIIDGIRIGKTLQVVAFGVEMGGKKHVLGFWEGSTENSRVCLDLLHDLKRRNLKMTGPILVVIDGSKALRSAIEEFFGEEAEVQRCHQHKIENVKSYLPKSHHAEYERKIRVAWGMSQYDDAHKALRDVVRDLERVNVQAAESLEEGFEETLTLHRLGLPEILRKSFSTTNLAESPFSLVRKVLRNVKRWQSNTDQARRWVAAAAIQIQRRFRKLKGYRSMTVLKGALEEEAKKKAARRTKAA